MISIFAHKRRMTEEEFDDLFRNSYARLYRLAYSMLHDQEDSRDIVSGVFADLLDKYKLSSDITEAYLFSMVRSRSIDLLRHRKVEDEVRQQLLLENRIQAMPDMEHEEHIKDVLSYINTQLTPQTRTVLRMCYDEKRKYKEVASELGISVQAVNKHISQALRKLREHFNTNSACGSKNN